MGSSFLPEPLWDDILYSVGFEQRYLKPISTMSKQLLSVSNNLKNSLHITTTNVHCLPKLLQRFPKIKHINLPFFLDPATFFGEINRFNIALESLDMSLMSTFPIKRLKELSISGLRTTLTSLKLSYVEDQTDVDGDLEIIAELFPNLEELDLFWGCNFTDNGVHKFSSKLKKLRKVGFGGNFSMTDASIRSLVENCFNLEEIKLDKCLNVSPESVSIVLRHGKSLKSIILKEMHDIGYGGPLGLAHNLSSLEFSTMVISDELLHAISRADIPLKRLSLKTCKLYSFHGIMPILGAYHSLLEYFAIEDLNSDRKLKGNNIVYFGPYFYNIKTIKLNNCCQMSTTQLIGLVYNCRNAKTLELKGNKIIPDQNPFTLYCDRKSELRSLNLSFCKTLTDICLAKVSRVCPELSELFVNGCNAITDKGVTQATRNCPDLQTIQMNGCVGVIRFGLDIRVSKLEVLEARRSSLDDDSLNLIALKCPDLMHLDVSNCCNVSGLGVREVVMNCNNLGKLGVTFKNVGTELEYWIRSKKPWLVNWYS